MVEAGHRCAIPTCRAVGPLQIEHINDWVRVQKHEFENMIVLCANCHGRKGNKRGQIDRKSLRQYKANLAIVNGRYGEVERRVLDHFAIIRPLWKSAQEAARDMLEADRQLDAIDAELAALRADAHKAASEGGEDITDRIFPLERKVKRSRALSEGFSEIFEQFENNQVNIIEVSRGSSFMLSYLIRDGLLRRAVGHAEEVIIDGRRIVDIYELTEAGHAFVDRWKTAKPLDEDV